MAIEIERKFLVLKSPRVLKGLTGEHILQGYLHEKGPTSRVRLVDDKLGYITIKGPRQGLGRPEFEYAIPAQDARELLSMCEDRLLTKVRYHVPVGNHIWHLDVFTGALQGLVTAEIELQSAEEPFARPTWAGPEVTFEKHYTNKRLASAQRIPLRKAA